MRFNVPKYVVPLSLCGTLIGVTVIVKDLKGAMYTQKGRLAGKTVIITGANSGIGRETALDLARRGGRVILACRDLKSANEVRDDIIQQTANNEVYVQQLDLASFASVREFADAINKGERRLDILINNAGVMNCPRTVTREGFEMQLGVNHLGHFLLTNLLLSKLKETPHARVINVSSTAHESGVINFADLNSEEHYDARTAYSQSKLANILFTHELAKKLQGTNVTTNALHPGVIRTRLWRHTESKSIFRLLVRPIQWIFFKNARQGAQTTLYCALSPELRGVSGKYFSDCKEKAPIPKALDDADAKRLWGISESWTKNG